MTDQVHDDEELYRRVVCDPDCYAINESGVLEVRRKAFSDPKNQPSVDRANLCDNDPARTQGDSRNGVVGLLTKQVRNTNTNELVPQNRYSVDVIPVPLPENKAHAEIRADPQITSNKVFQRLRTSLAFLANQRKWLILPYDYRDTLSSNH